MSTHASNPGGKAASARQEISSSGITDSDRDSVFDNLDFPSTSRIRQVFAIGGGKGGVGKSLIASSLAISLARSAGRVTAIDLDLGGSNLHTALGVDLPKHTLSDFFTNRIATLGEIAVPTGVSQLEIISGAQDAVNIAQLNSKSRRHLFENVPSLNSDYALFDLGAGTTYSTLDFFLYADLGIVTVLPEPTSIENAYRFIKSAYYRYLWHSKPLRSVRPLIEAAMDAKSANAIRSPSDLFREVTKSSSEMGVTLKNEIEKFRPKLIVNQVRTQADIDIGHSVKSVCKKYFGIEMDYLGYLEYDSAVWQAVRRKKPLVLEFPNSRLVMSIDRIVQSLIRQHQNSKCGLR